MTKNKQSTAATRRKFLGGAAVAGVATIAMPQVSRAQTVTLKMQSALRRQLTSSTSTAGTMSRKVNEMGGGRLKIDYPQCRRRREAVLGDGCASRRRARWRT